MNPSFFSGFNSGLTLDSFSNFDPVAAFARSNPYLASLGLSSQGQNQVNNVNNMLNGGPGYGLQNLPSGFSFLNSAGNELTFPDLGPIDQDALNANMQQGGFTPGMSGQQMQSQIQQNIANAQPVPAPTPAPVQQQSPPAVNVVNPVTNIGTQFDAQQQVQPPVVNPVTYIGTQQPQSPFQQGSGPGASTPFASAFDSQLQNAQTGNATGALQTQLQNFQSSNQNQALPTQLYANGGRAGYAKGKLVKKAIEGIASLFKDRGKYFNPTSQEFGEVSTLLKGSPKNKLVSDEQMFEAKVMQSMMKDPKYTDFAKSRLGESRQDKVLEDLIRMSGDDTINLNTARGAKRLRELPFTERKGITGATSVDDEADRILKSMQDMETKAGTMMNESTFLMDEVKLKTEALDMFMREIDDGFEPSEALQRMIRKLKMARTKQADGGRVGLLSGGLLKKLFKRGLAGAPDDVAKDVDEMMLMRPKATMGMDPSKTADAQQFKNVMRDPNTDLERILKDRADGTKATPLDAKTVRELESLVQDSPRYSPEQKAVFFKLIDIEKIRANHLYNTGEELPDHVLEMLYREGAGDFNQGGRVGMFMGGIPAAFKSVAKLVNRGIKPFGQKQTYRQKVKNVGTGNFDEIDMKTSIEVDKLTKANDVDGLIDMYESVLSGSSYGTLNPKQRKDIATKIRDAFEEIPLDRRSQDDLAADLFNMEQYYDVDTTATRSIDVLEKKTDDVIQRIKDGKKVSDRDINQAYDLKMKQRSKNKKTGLDAIKEGIDKGQIKVTKAEDLLDALDRESGKNVIPFKPKTKKAAGGRIGMTVGGDATSKQQLLASQQEMFEKLFPYASNDFSNTNAYMNYKKPASSDKLLSKFKKLYEGANTLTKTQKNDFATLAEGMGSLFRSK